jgi:hypothetical protein
MLIVVEGTSAAGKTTWCRRFAAGRALLEREPPTGPDPAGASDPDPADPVTVARFWADSNARRWRTACAMAERLGWVALDTDPFKLHWTWSLWVSGLASRAYWDASRETSRAAFADGALGLPDLVLFADLDAATLRRQKQSDMTRTRSRHEMHLCIAPALKRWYVAMAALDPERVRFALPTGVSSALLRLGPRAERSGAALFDRFIAGLEKG